GVYALYRKNRLYYVGLASKLSGRLKAHIRDGHRSAWDRFSIYLTINDQHLNELESMLLRIASPRGKKQSGKLAGSGDMRRSVMRAIRDKQNKEVERLFERRVRREESETEPEFAMADGDTARLFPRGARLKATNKGRVFRARLRRDGSVRFRK